jgi:xylose isomerase
MRENVMYTYFPKMKPVLFEGPQSRNPLSFKWYDAEQKVAGRRMKEWLRFSIAYWHTFKGTGSDPFGAATLPRPWNHGHDPLVIAKNTLTAAFEFAELLGVDFYCFHDRDIVAEGTTLRESNRRIDQVVKQALRLQKETGVKLLWNTANLFSHPRYAHGASTSPDAEVFAYAGAQVKKMLEVAKELGAENYVFWGGREGYETLLNTDMKREQDHLAAFLGMAVDYAKEIGFEGQFLIEPKPKEPTKHQYDFDAATVIGFLTRHGLRKHFKLNIEANHATLAAHTFEHDLMVASMNGMLGSVDANRGDLLLGWDTDQFPSDIYGSTLAMYVIIRQGGLGRGGLNFDAKVRRGSTDLEDLFIAHIGAMDAFARGLVVAAKLHQDDALESFIRNRYASFDEGLGARIEKGRVTLRDLEAHVLKYGEPKPSSGKQEMLENILNQYLFA